VSEWGEEGTGVFSLVWLGRGDLQLSASVRGSMYVPVQASVRAARSSPSPACTACTPIALPPSAQTARRATSSSTPLCRRAAGSSSRLTTRASGDDHVFEGKVQKGGRGDDLTHRRAYFSSYPPPRPPWEIAQPPGFLMHPAARVRRRAHRDAGAGHSRGALARQLARSPRRDGRLPPAPPMCCCW
jgi:hypothetical protein